MAEWDLSGDLEKDLATAKLMALQQAAAAPMPPASPLTPTPGEPGSGQTIESKVGFDPFKSAPLLERLGAAAPMATMGFGAPGFLGKLGVAEKAAPFIERRLMDLGIGAAPSLARGDVGEAAKEGGLTALAGSGLEKGGQFLRYVGSAIPKKAFDAAQEAKIGDWLKAKIPWWNELNVSEMATSTKAKDALRQGYDAAFVAARDKIPEEMTASIPIDLANALKLKGEGGMDTRFMSPKVLQMLQEAGRAPAEAADTVAVNARELLDKLPGSKGKLRAQILGGLDPVAGNVIPEARDAYRTGQGWMELANRGGIGKEGVFNAQTAQQALRKPAGAESLAQKALQPRGMQELEAMVQGPLKEPITSVTPNSLAWHLGLGAGGALSGLGLHGMHGLAGGLAAMTPRPTFYRNVPPMYPQAGPLAEQGLRAVMPGFLQNMRSPEGD